MATAETGAIEHENTARLYLAVGRLTRSLRRIGSGGAELGHGAVSALFTLVNQGSMRLGDLATKEGVAPPTLSRIVAALVEGGFVRREPDPNDGRASLVTATDAGRQVASGLYSIRLRELQRRLDRLTPDQIHLLVAALPALEALVADPALGASLTKEEHVRLMAAAGRLSRPSKLERLKASRTIRKEKHRRLLRADREALANTGIREARKSDVFIAPDKLLPAPQSPVEEVRKPRICYVCKETYTRLHHFYDGLCRKLRDSTSEQPVHVTLRVVPGP